MGSRSRSSNTSTTDTRAEQLTGADEAIVGDNNTRNDNRSDTDILDLSDRSVTDLSDRSITDQSIDTSDRSINDESFTYEEFYNSQDSNTETNDNRDFSTLDASTVDNSVETTTISSFSEDNSQLNFTDSSDNRQYFNQETLSDDVAIAAINANASLAATLSRGHAAELAQVQNEASIANAELTSQVFDFVARSNQATGDFIGGVIATADETIAKTTEASAEAIAGKDEIIMYGGLAAAAGLAAIVLL